MKRSVRKLSSQRRSDGRWSTSWILTWKFRRRWRMELSFFRVLLLLKSILFITSLYQMDVDMMFDVFENSLWLVAMLDKRQVNWQIMKHLNSMLEWLCPNTKDQQLYFGTLWRLRSQKFKSSRFWKWLSFPTASLLCLRKWWLPTRQAVEPSHFTPETSELRVSNIDGTLWVWIPACSTWCSSTSRKEMSFVGF